MTSFSFIRSLFAGAALAAGLAGAAMAQDAVATTDLNMRAGPGTAYAVIASVPEGAGVDYVGRGCAGSWCNVSYRGIIGWLSASYLDEIGEARPPVVVRPAPPIYVPPPVYVPGPDYRPGWDRPGWDRPRPRPPGGWDRPRPPDGGWNRPRPPGDGGWNRPRPPGGGGWQPGGPGPGPRPPVVRPPQPPGDGGWRPPGGGQGPGPRPPVVAPPASGGSMVPLRPPGASSSGVPTRGGTGRCANVPIGVPCQ